MEDAVAIHPRFCRTNRDNDNELHYFAVYERHGCSQNASLVEELRNSAEEGRLGVFGGGRRSSMIAVAVNDGHCDGLVGGSLQRGRKLQKSSKVSRLPDTQRWCGRASGNWPTPHTFNNPPIGPARAHTLSSADGMRMGQSDASSALTSSPRSIGSLYASNTALVSQLVIESDVLACCMSGPFAGLARRMASAEAGNSAHSSCVTHIVLTGSVMLAGPRLLYG
nr:probable protein phosphatase 2C 24 [Ipomoea batatas]